MSNPAPADRRRDMTTTLIRTHTTTAPRTAPSTAGPRHRIWRHGLAASVATRAIYCAVVLAALIRIAAPLAGNWSVVLLEIAAVAWTASFAGFVVFYGPILLKPRL